jgi:acyl-CoA reductase-like NAD-dependent aldehyde dehydrogenase
MPGASLVRLRHRACARRRAQGERRLGQDSVAERALILNRIADKMEANLDLLALVETLDNGKRIADKMEANLDLLALVETLDNGKPIRESTYADLPLCLDHWR